MRREAIAAVIAILVVASLGIGYLSGSRARGTETITSTSTSVSTSTLTSERTVTSTTTSTSTVVAPLSLSSGVSPEGLQLKMMLNSSAIQSHGAIIAQIEVINTLNRNVSAGTMPEWNQTTAALSLNMADLNDYDYTCSQNPTQFLVDFALLEGHYSAGNISSAGTPLMLRTSFFNPPCPGFFVGQSEVTFLPNGDQAVATYYLPSKSSGPVTAALNATTFYCVPTAGLQAPIAERVRGLSATGTIT